MVHVQDTGRGLEKEEMDKLFKRFGKLQRTLSMNSEGVGLGLNIVKQLVELAGGQIGVESAGSSQGSLFKFSMKMQEMPEEEHPSALLMEPDLSKAEADREESGGARGQSASDSLQVLNMVCDSLIDEPSNIKEQDRPHANCDSLISLQSEDANNRKQN